ncbi:MAG TPA: HAD family hydrolase [Bacteroidia bacterium]|nr:HAD family hydrolase [Bacteroidia bacterium]
MKTLQLDKSWTIFLDRDGVLNKKLDNDYVRSWATFQVLPGVLEALKKLSAKAGRIVVVTNQQGIGKGLYTTADLQEIHSRFLKEVQEASGRIDHFYFCPNLASENNPCRKPGIGMALEAKQDFPEIDFSKSVIVGDSHSDMEFGRDCGMVTVFLSQKEPESHKKSLIDLQFPDLLTFTNFVLNTPSKG